MIIYKELALFFLFFFVLPPVVENIFSHEMYLSTI